MNNEPVSRETYLSVCRDLADMTAEKDKQALLASDLHAALQLMKAELKERGERLQLLEKQVEAFKKFYEWYGDAGSWSHVSLDPKDGSRWILRPEESAKGDHLQIQVDECLRG
jgi:hypothetical protein